MLHILDNATYEMDTTHLDHFEGWYADLKNLGGFLCSGDYRNRFVVRCLRRSMVGGKHAEETFATSPPVLYEKRWGHIVNFMLAAREQLLLCRVAWDARAFAGNDGRVLKGVVMDQLSKTLQNPWFYAYFEMMLKVHSAIDSVRKFVERCPCHPGSREQSSARQLGSPCPMNTLRAPELAAGALTDILEKLMTDGVSSLLKDTCVALPSDQWASITLDFQKGMTAFTAIIQTKCSFWGQLPWRACGMMHWDESVAVKCASLCMDAWDNLEQSAQQSHLPFLQRLLSDPLCRNHLDEWVAGEIVRTQLPSHVLEILAPLLFVPVAERVIEAKHSIMKKRAGFSRAGPVACSLALRTPMFLGPVLQKHPAELNTLIECFEEARHVRAFAERRGLPCQYCSMLAPCRLTGEREPRSVASTLQSLSLLVALSMSVATFLP